MKPILLIRFLLILFLVNFKSMAAEDPAPSFDQLPFRFRENKGQWTEPVRYGAWSGSSNVYFLNNGLSITHWNSNEQSKNYLTWNLQFLNANPHAAPVCSDSRPALTQYIQPDKVIKLEEEYALLRYDNIYANIDLQYYGYESTLKYDYILHPGASVSDIKMKAEGIKHYEIVDGELIVHHAWGTVKENKPYSYQVINGKQQEVKVRFKLYDKLTYGFEIYGAYDPAVNLIIDPIQLIWGTYIGSDNPRAQGYMYDITVDKNKDIYGTGYYQSSFPTTPGAYQSSNKGGDIDGSNGDAYLFKMATDGKSLLFSTYIGGVRDEEGRAIWVTTTGRVYIAGNTNSTDFPTTSSAYQKTRRGLADGFVSCFDAYQGTLLFSTYIGGLAYDRINDLKTDNAGKVWIGGETQSVDYPVFKTTAALSVYQGGTNDGMISKLSPNLDQLDFSTYVGGAADDKIYALASYTNTITYSGYTASANYTTTAVAFQTQHQGGLDLMVGRFNTTSNTLLYATYVGGTFDEVGYDIDCNTSGDTFITGYTTSANYPNSFPSIPLKGQKDVFVTALSNDGTALVYSRLVGGKDNETGTSIIVNVQDQAFVVGNTVSADFPINQTNGIDKGYQVFLFSIDYTGEFLGYSIMLGGSKDDYDVPKVAFSSKEYLCEVYIGFTSNSMDLPTTGGAYQPTKLNGSDRNTQPALFKYYFGPALPFCTNPGVPSTVEPLNHYSYLCQDCRVPCDSFKLTTCPGLVNIPVSERPANDPAYFYPWVYTYLDKNIVYTQPPVLVNFPGDSIHGTIQISDGCNALKLPFVLQQPEVSVSISASSPYLCSSNPIMTLEAILKGFGKVLWNTGDTTKNITITSPGSYTVTASEGTCGEIKTASIEIKAGNPPGDPFFIKEFTYCFPATYTLNAIAQGDDIPTNYKWTPTGQTGSSISITQGGTYCVEKVNACGIVSSCVTIRELLKPLINLGKDTVLCQGQTLLLSVPSEYQNLPIVWSTGETTTSIVAQPGTTYWVKVTNTCGTAYDEIVVGISPDKPVVDLGPDLVRCQAIHFPLTLTAGFQNASILWSTGETTQSINVNKGGLYWVKAFNGCGIDEDTIDIVSDPALSITLGPDRRACAPASFVLDPGYFGAGSTYLWSNGASTQTITVLQSGTYTVTATNSCGTGTASVKVTVDNGIPAFTLGPDFFLCPGATRTLNSPVNGSEYLWSDSSIFSSLTIDTAGLYWLEVKNSCGISRDTVVATTQVPLYTNLPSDTSICFPNILLLSVPLQNATYLWNTGSTNRNLVVSTPGTYTVTLTNACESISSSVVVSFESTAPVVDLGPDLIRCGPAPINETLNAGVAYKYLWNTGATTSSIVATAAGQYKVRVSNGCGFNSDSMIIIGDPQKTKVNDVSFCNTDSISLDAGNIGATYLWKPGNQTTQTIKVAQTGEYTVEITNACGALKDTILVSLETQPPVFDLGPDLRICSPLTKTFSLNFTGSSYLWSTGSTTSSITVSDAGNYQVVVTNGCGSTTDSVMLAVDLGVPVVDLGQDTMVCNPFVVSLDAKNPGASYLWTPGNSTNQLNHVFTQGLHKVTVINGCGSTSDEIEIAGFDKPVLQLKDTANCNTPITFDVSNLASTYLWMPANSNQPVFTATRSGTYTIGIGHPCGKFEAITHVIINTSKPVIDLGVDTLLCTPAGYSLEAGTYEGGKHKWLPSGSTDATLPVNQPGTYGLEVTNYCGTSQDFINVGANPIQLLALPDTTVCSFTEVTVRTTQVPGYTYEWYNQQQNQEVLSTAHTATVVPVYPYSNYVAKVFSGPCYNLDTVTINVYKEVKPKITADEFEGYIPLGIHFRDANQAGTTYTWNFDDGGTSTEASPYHLFKDERYYTVSVHAENDAGCFGNDTIQVLAFDIFIPNLITPNGDNLNDYWDLTNLNPYIHVEIYNRWGVKVYEKDNYVNEWDGQDLPTGVYFFEVKDVKYKKEFKGWVHVLK